MNPRIKQLLMSFVTPVIIVAGVIIIVIALWSAIFVYIEPGEMGVLVKKTGTALDRGQILARTGQRGVQADVLAEGRHFINPVIEKIEIESCVHIRPGKIGVVTSKVGKEPAAERIIVNDDEGRR